MAIGFIGAGKVGFSMGKFFMQGGVPVTGYYSRRQESAQEAASFTNTKAYAELEELVQDSDALFLTVPDMHTKYVYPNLFMSREDTETLSNLQADIEKTINRHKADWIMNGFTDADWEKFLDDLDAYGLEEYLGLFQKYLDAYNAEMAE